jgi:hypothetical protein
MNAELRGALLAACPRRAAVWSRHQGIDGKHAPSIFRHAGPVAARLIQLDQPQIGRDRVAIPHRQFLEDFMFGGWIGQLPENDGQKQVGVIRSDVIRIKGPESFEHFRGFRPSLLDDELRSQTSQAIETLRMLFHPGGHGRRIRISRQLHLFPGRAWRNPLGSLPRKLREFSIYLI